MPATFRVDISSAAENDIQEIWSFIARDDPETATRFIRQLKKRVNTLQRSPRRCPLISENTLMHSRYRHLVYGKYRAIFRISDKRVLIVRVIHAARLLDPSSIDPVAMGISER